MRSDISVFNKRIWMNEWMSEMQWPNCLQAAMLHLLAWWRPRDWSDKKYKSCLMSVIVGEQPDTQGCSPCSQFVHSLGCLVRYTNFVLFSFHGQLAFFVFCRIVWQCLVPVKLVFTMKIKCFKSDIFLSTQLLYCYGHIYETATKLGELDTHVQNFRGARTPARHPQWLRLCRHCMTGGRVSMSDLQGCRGDGISIHIPIPYPQESPLESPWESPYPRNPK